MDFKRTANAGGLITLDGVSILIDGVCRELKPYQGTPQNILNELSSCYPDILAFTHTHTDHYDEAYVNMYKKDTLRSVLRPELSDIKTVKNVEIIGIPTRHIGKNDVPHLSYIINGSKCVWFTGDASPLVFKNFTSLPVPDVLIVTHAYVTSPSAWKIVKSTGAKKVILLHMPKREDDEYGLWDAMENIIRNDPCLCIPKIGEIINI